MEQTDRRKTSSHIIKYDLHIHSNISDGTLLPYEIVEMSQKKGLNGISITDHDDISIDNISAYSEKHELKYIYGIEFSTDRTNLHILGYNLDIGSSELISYLNFEKFEREKAIEKMCKKTFQYGIPVDFEELKSLDTRSLGRPHLAKLMIEKGYVDNIYEAFQKYLKDDRPIFVDYKKYNYMDILDIIIKSNGISVIAHPGMLRLNVFQSFIYKAIKNGLRGIEVYYPRHNEKHVKYFKEIAKEYNLIITGGSDFHGAIKPDINIGDEGISQEEFEKFILLSD